MADNGLVPLASAFFFGEIWKRWALRLPREGGGSLPFYGGILAQSCPSELCPLEAWP